MTEPKYYNHHTGAIGLAIFGLANFGMEYYDFGIGVEARGSIAKTKTYRVRTGNGHYGTILGKKYQDEMDYKVVRDPKTEDQQAWRGIFADSVASALLLTEEQREPYKKTAQEEGGQSWISVFIREYLEEQDGSPKMKVPLPRKPQASPKKVRGRGGNPRERRGKFLKNFGGFFFKI